MDIECTCSALRMAARHLSQAYDAALSPERMTVSQYAVLSSLARRFGDDRPTMQHLAESLALDRTTLAHNLRPLLRDGLVAVEPDPLDRRQRRIRLTPRGRTKRDRCLPLWRDIQDRFDAAFGHERSLALRASLMDIAGQPDRVAPTSAKGR